MGLFLLNISVDTADLNPKYVPEDLSINDQESIIEIVIEKFLGYEDAIKEYDDHDTEEHNKTNIKIELFAQNSACTHINTLAFETKNLNFPNYTPYLTIGFQKIDTPPPKV